MRIVSRTEKVITFKYQTEDFCLFERWRFGGSGVSSCPFVEEDFADGYCTTYRCMIDKERVENLTRCRIPYKNKLEGKKIVTEVRIE